MVVCRAPEPAIYFPMGILSFEDAGDDGLTHHKFKAVWGNAFANQFEKHPRLMQILPTLEDAQVYFTPLLQKDRYN